MAVVVGAIILAGIVYAALSFNISAAPTPGSFETTWANRVKAWYIHRASQSPAPPPPPAYQPTAAAGLFSMACATCHGSDGRHPSSTGLAMYPRVLDLGSGEVQRFSDPELYWIITNGIRFSGMPGFGKILGHDDLWQLTLFVRHLDHPIATTAASPLGWQRSHAVQ